MGQSVLLDTTVNINMFRTVILCLVPNLLICLPQRSYLAPDDILDISPSRTVSVSKLAPITVKEPVAIIRSDFTGPNDGSYKYSYETANGIKQSVVGEMKLVDKVQVYVMRGSYSYPGTDGQLYVVDWYADETGYHPSAPHLPKSVQPNHPSVAAAVRAQLAFAAEEDAAASSSSLVYAAPGEDSSLDEVFLISTDGLAGYGDEEPAASQLLDSYSLPSYN